MCHLCVCYYIPPRLIVVHAINHLVVSKMHWYFADFDFIDLPPLSDHFIELDMCSGILP